MAGVLAIPVMDNYNGRFGERTVADVGSLVANPQSLLSKSNAISKRAVPNYQLELDILSAASYPLAPPASILTSRSRKRTTSQHLLGGVMMDEIDHRSNTSPPEERLPPKKKTRRATKGSSDEETSKKQRGRPRLDPQDETAADRRRTQIRLAQRAS